MSTDRRGFLRYSLAVLGTVATSKSVAKALETAPASAPAAGDGPHVHTHALTADHQVLHSHGGEHATTAPAAAVSNAAARQGIAGRKWVMVIDLAKCDGCGH